MQSLLRSHAHIVAMGFMSGGYLGQKRHSGSDFTGGRRAGRTMKWKDHQTFRQQMRSNQNQLSRSLTRKLSIGQSSGLLSRTTHSAHPRKMQTHFLSDSPVLTRPTLETKYVFSVRASACAALSRSSLHSFLGPGVSLCDLEPLRT